MKASKIVLIIALILSITLVAAYSLSGNNPNGETLKAITTDDSFNVGDFQITVLDKSTIGLSLWGDVCGDEIRYSKFSISVDREKDYVYLYTADIPFYNQILRGLGCQTSLSGYAKTVSLVNDDYDLKKAKKIFICYDESKCHDGLTELSARGL